MPENKIERRYIPSAEVECRIKTNDTGDTLEGYAAVFDKWGEGYGFKETVRKGAFRKTIREGDARGLINHNPDKLLSRVTAGTLRLKEDKKGLHYEMDLGNQSYAVDLRESVERGDITGNSFSFQTIKDAWDNEENKRELLEVKLLDVGPVTFPFYEQTSLNLRSILIDNGFDIEALSGLMTRAKRGITFTQSDIDLINSSIEILRSYIPDNEPEPSPERHSTNWMGILLRELELDEYE